MLIARLQLAGRNGVSVAGAVRSISVAGSSLTDRGLALVARRCPGLQELRIPASPAVTNGGLLDLTSRCPQLQHLDLAACNMVSAVNVAGGPAETRHLQVQVNGPNIKCIITEREFYLIFCRKTFPFSNFRYYQALYEANFYKILRLKK